MGVTNSCTKHTNDVDADGSAKRGYSLVKALNQNATLKWKKHERIEWIIKFEHLSNDEKQQIVNIESRRKKAERLSPREPSDLSFYHEVTFHIPDDPDEVETTRNIALKELSLSGINTATATATECEKSVSHTHQSIDVPCLGEEEVEFDDRHAGVRSCWLVEALGAQDLGGTLSVGCQQRNSPDGSMGTAVKPFCRMLNGPPKKRKHQHVSFSPSLDGFN